MNPLLQTSNQSPLTSFNEFARTMTPEGAKSQLEEMVRTGKLSESQLQQAIELARQLAPQFGIK